MEMVDFQSPETISIPLEYVLYSQNGISEMFSGPEQRNIQATLDALISGDMRIDDDFFHLEALLLRWWQRRRQSAF